MGPLQSPLPKITFKIYWALTTRQTWFSFTCIINSFSSSNPRQRGRPIISPHFMENRGPEQLSNLHKVTRRVGSGAGVGKPQSPNSSQSLASRDQGPAPPHPTHQKCVSPFSKLPTPQTMRGSQKRGGFPPLNSLLNLTNSLLGWGVFALDPLCWGYTKFGGGRRAGIGKEAFASQSHLGFTPQR